jgi:hypothetical protein
MSRIIDTFYCSAGIDNLDDLLMLDGKLMTIKETKKLNRVKQAFIDQIEHLDGKKSTRCKPYDHLLKYDEYRRLKTKQLQIRNN